MVVEEDMKMFTDDSFEMLVSFNQTTWRHTA
jgi:hypothetical protein